MSLAASGANLNKHVLAHRTMLSARVKTFSTTGNYTTGPKYLQISGTDQIPKSDNRIKGISRFNPDLSFEP